MYSYNRLAHWPPSFSFHLNFNLKYFCKSFERTFPPTYTHTHSLLGNFVYFVGFIFWHNYTHTHTTEHLYMFFNFYASFSHRQCAKKIKNLKMKIFLSYNNNYNNYLIKNAVAWVGAAVAASRLIFPFYAIFVEQKLHLRVLWHLREN